MKDIFYFIVGIVLFPFAVVFMLLSIIRDLGEDIIFYIGNTIHDIKRRLT